jgi:O-acetyl-ADP-ribose deacetylase (regulator of RNase III)
MARFYDPSISGLIRYLGSERDKEGNVIVDTIADALKECVLEKKPVDGVNVIHFPSIKPGLAFTTESGKLKDSHGVQSIIHVATVFGEIGQGYTPIKNLGICVQNALEQADQFAFGQNKSKVSILFPLFGTGTAKGDLDGVAKNLFYSALAYFETKQDSRVDRLYFLVWKQFEKEACVKALDDMQDLTPKQPA